MGSAHGAVFNSMDLRMTAERRAIDRIHEYVFELFSFLAHEADSNAPGQTAIIPLGEIEQMSIAEETISVF